MSKVVYLGNFAMSWSTETHIARSFEALDWDVVRVQEPPGGGTEDTLRELTTNAVGADLVLWTRNRGLPNAATKVWRLLADRGVVTAGWHLDVYCGLPRARTLDVRRTRTGKRAFDHQRACAPFWTMDHVFTPDGSDQAAAWFERIGVNHHYLPPAIVADECRPGRRQRFLTKFPLVFVGAEGRSYHPQHPWRAELLRWLEAEYPDRFRRYGHGRRLVRGTDLNDLYASATVVVGDSLHRAGHDRYWSDRPYETVGRGGFLLHPRIVGLEEHFTDGAHLRLYEYGAFDQLREMIDHYLAHPADAHAIAHAGQRHVGEHHTYTHRVREALTTMGLT